MSDETFGATNREFLEWRLRHDLSLGGAAEILGISRRTVAYYSSGEKPVPKSVILACKGLDADGKKLSAPGAPQVAPSRQGRKAMTGYFAPELSQAVRITAVQNDMSLQDAMGEALNDWLQKMGQARVDL